VMVRMLGAGAVSLLTFPEDVILVLLGAEWLEAAPMLRLFGVFSITYALAENPRCLFMGLGESRMFVQFSTVQAVLTVPAVLLSAIFGGVEHVAASVVVASVLAYGYAWFLARKLVTVSAWATLGVPALLMAGVAVGLHRLAQEGVFDGVPSLVRIVIPVAAYLAGLLAIERGLLWKELQFFRSQL
jgi:O-antigen/teichoic acid export membrane protein